MVKQKKQQRYCGKTEGNAEESGERIAISRNNEDLSGANPAALKRGGGGAGTDRYGLYMPRT